MEKFNFKNNIGQENKLLQIEIYKFTNFCKLQNYTSVNIFSKDIFEPKSFIPLSTRCNLPNP
ncbi:cell envelope [Streptococcus pneumoniae]|nr:cell envelope [Streptococcus pneumoniae]